MMMIVPSRARARGAARPIDTLREERFMPNYGVIDLGSNSIRLVIYEVKDNNTGLYSSKDFSSLISDKVMAGLSAFVEEGVFTPAGIDRAVNVLKGHAKRARYFRCERLDVFATAVLRNCVNSAEAVRAISKRADMPITLLSSRDEAHLGFVGATSYRTIERGTVIDIGGGSTEITRVRKGRDSNHTSIGVGSLSSFARHVRGILPTDSEMQAISDSLWNLVSQLPDCDGYRSDQFFGIGGSIRAAAKMFAQMSNLPERPKSLSRSDLETILDFARTNSHSFTHQALKASTERVHTIVPGIILMHRLMSEFGGDRIEICKYGVREGYLLERMLAPKKPALAKKAKVTS